MTLNNIPITISGGVVYAGTSASLNLGTSPVTLASDSTFTVVNNTLTLAGAIAGSSNLTVAGAGTLAITANNANGGLGFSGNWNLNGGNLAVSADNQLGLTPAVAGTNGVIVIQGGQLNPTASFTLGANRTLQVGNSTSGNGSINVNTGVTLTYGGTILNTVNGGGVLVKNGNGTLVLTGNSNAYSGGTILNAGTLNINVNSTLGNADGALGFQGSAPTAGAFLTFAGNSTLTAGNTTDLNPLRLLTVNPGVVATFNTNGQALSIEGSIAGTYAPASFTTTLGTSNSNLVFTANATNASLTGFNATAGNTITVSYVNGVGNNVPTTASVTGNAITVTLGTNGSGVVTATANNIISAINASTPAKALVSAAVTGGSNGAGVASSLAASSLAGGIIPGNISQNGTGILTLNGSSDFAGGYTINSGTLRIGNAGAMGVGPLTFISGSFDNTIGANSSLVYAANATNVTITGANATAGNTISIRYVNPGVSNPTANLTITGNAIVVNLATNANGSVITNGSQIIALINGNATANALVTVSNNLNNSGSGYVSAMSAPLNLSGGTSGNLTSASLSITSAPMPPGPIVSRTFSTAT